MGLYKTVPIAARRDPHLYEILALLDALRDGRARERRLAEGHLVARATGLFLTDPAATGLRPTKDVDTISEVGSYAEYAKLSERSSPFLKQELWSLSP